MEWIVTLVDRFVTEPDDLARARALVLTMITGGAEGAAAFLQLCRLIGESVSDSEQLLAATDLVDQSIVARTGALVIASFARVRMEYPSRPDAQVSRQALSDLADTVTEDAGAAFGADLHSWLVRLVGEAVLQISAIAATRAPLVRVETGISLPSTLLAYDLYGDSGRAEDLVARSRSGTPLVMPVVFEALAS